MPIMPTLYATVYHNALIDFLVNFPEYILPTFPFVNHCSSSHSVTITSNNSIYFIILRVEGLKNLKCEKKKKYFYIGEERGVVV